MKFFNIILALCIVAAPALAGDRRIVVTGEGRVDRVPDMAVITLGVSHQAENARDAVGEVAVLSGAILSALKEMGIEGRDMRTSNLALSPLWQHRSSSNTEPEVTGYSASNLVTVRVRDLAVLSDILGRVTTEGANMFQGLQFTLQNPKPARNEARRLAVADGTEKAQLYAEAAGVILGPLISLNEASSNMPRPMAMAHEAFVADMAMPVAEGELSLTASVTMVFAIAE